MDHHTEKNGLIIYMKNKQQTSLPLQIVSPRRLFYVPLGADLFIPGGTHMHHSFGKHCSRNTLGFSNMLS